MCDFTGVRADEGALASTPLTLHGHNMGICMKIPFLWTGKGGIPKDEIFMLLALQRWTSASFLNRIFFCGNEESAIQPKKWNSKSGSKNPFADSDRANE